MDVGRLKTTTKDSEPLASVGICRQTIPVTTTSKEPPAHQCSGHPDPIFDLPDRGRLRDVREVAALLKTSRDAVYGLISSGSLPVTRPTGSHRGYRISIPDLEAYVRSTRVTPNEKAPARAASHAEAGEDTR